ncbi:MAG: glycosyltransferase family 39 protein [Phormidium sp. BM_Day4_Bin.17]|nr:glycosyltransferase family 39 protein [Phormidium sp. BM_Day4_Bin.17]UCJ10505.1 MAG: glycosyltransferase family 39 protein [Phormidium sp. PBR-2020]
MVYSFVSFLELLLFCWGGFLILHYPGRRLSESLSLGIGLALIAVSFIFQAAFLIKLPEISIAIEILMAVGIIIATLKQTDVLKQLLRSFSLFFARNTAVVSLSFIPIAYAGIKSFFAPQESLDVLAYHLPRVSLFQAESTVLLDRVCKMHTAIFPVGADILPHLLLRFDTDIGVSFFSFLAYISIILGNYCLSRRYLSERGSLAVCLVIASLPQLFLQSWIAKNNIFTASAAMFCLLAVTRILDKPTSRNLFLVLLGLTFGVSAKTTFLAFALPFTIFFGISVIRKYGLRIWVYEIRQSWYWWLIGLIPLVVLSQLWLFIHNHIVWGNWSGPPAFVDFHKNQDGIIGGLANLVRFGFQFIDFLNITNVLLEQIASFSPVETLKSIYDSIFYPIFGEAALQSQRPFSMIWRVHQTHGGFGPLGLLIVIPSILASVRTRPAFTRNVALTLLSFLLIFCLSSAWSLYKIRMLVVFFACSGPCIANLFSRLVTHGRREVLLLLGTSFISISLLFYVSLYEQDLRVLNSYYPWRWSIQDSYWIQSDWGRDRLYSPNKFYGDERLETLANFFSEGSRVGLLTQNETRLHYYFIHIPQAEFKDICMDDVQQRAYPVQKFATLEEAISKTSSPLDYVLCVGDVCQTPGPKLRERFRFERNQEATIIFEVLPPQ